MNQQNKHELYESPEVEVIEMNALQVMCTSPGDTTDMPVDETFNF